ncbi:nodulation protein NfeD [Flammeovirga yaeyamensis]|uniref:Nodulation protein NfeD n=1 Tax=Flammeovirga yaeyamensis TaxID=367791 RepID=A0AAX1N556_9BACT|nr:NfeD family protein [Flammeovirga yaeyamensis]MBB3698649.1 membrane-bound serine protease (ClpP class) [Flammeovirga yaeyamensis]NMF34005.1 nodulation protein NfeD [Flammeovirga yaeyamensis]QWG00993.1 nodulation protein NfeD [Flammeovirga yaeyamensis]
MKKIFYIITLLFTFQSINVFAEKDPVVFQFEIREDINPVMSRQVKLALDEATEQKADYVIIDMDTYGGAVNDADKIRQMILDYSTPVYVFINKNAASAGALISIACDSIYMETGSNIGAATVVMGGTGEAAPDKYQSYMRSMMRSTAESNGRNPDIAEAMVDQDLVVEGISEEGEVITFTVSEAIKNGYCEAKVAGVKDIMKRSGVDSYTLVNYEQSTTESIISLFLNPAISGILILIILGGLYFELQSPGVGFPLIAAIVAAILYLTPYYLNGMADNWEIVLIALGIVLIILEIFVVPGFGVTGVSGISLLVIGLVLVMLENDFLDFTFVDSTRIWTSLISVMGAMFVAGMFILTFAHKIMDMPMFNKVGLRESMTSEDGYSADVFEASFVGQVGIAHTVLRPSGKIKIDNDYYDATTEGGFIEKGTEVEVVSQNNMSLRVRELQS